MKVSAVIAILLCLCGCTRVVSPAARNFNTSHPGVVQTKQVGEALFEKGTITVLPGFRAQRDTDIPVMENILFPPVKRGDTWLCRSRIDENYLCSNPKMQLVDVQATSDEKLPDRLPLFMLGREGQFRGLYFPVRGYTAAPDAPMLQGLFTPVEVPQGGSFKQELIYSGKGDDSIRLVYREFREDMSRPSLFKALNINLSTLDIIQFDDVIIEVLEATESFIRYRIK